MYRQTNKQRGKQTGKQTDRHGAMCSGRTGRTGKNSVRKRASAGNKDTCSSSRVPGSRAGGRAVDRTTDSGRRS
ncbi:hypothetical protein C2E23DRAFT_841283 [Lenzites betulinus]|nr:hypothetical protein C2E23DRAFT_841283 [Lenzites betulinus]